MKQLIRLVILSLFLISVTQPVAQEKEIDSLQKVIHHTKDKLVLTQLYNNISLNYRRGNPDSMAYWAHKALNLSKAIDSKEEFANANKNLGQALKIMGKFKEALDPLSINHEYALSKKDSTRLTRSFSMIGSVYYQLSQDSKALSHYTQSLSIAHKVKDSLSMMAGYARIGILHKNTGNYPEALNSLLMSKEIIILMNDYSYMNTILRMIGTIYFDIGEYDKCIKIFNEALVYMEQYKSSQDESDALHHIGKANFELGNYDLANEYFHKSIQLNNRNNAQAQQRKRYVYLGKIFLKKEKLDSAYYYLNKAYLISKKVDDEASVAAPLSEYYIKTKQFKNAEEVLKEALGITRYEVAFTTKGILSKSLYNVYNSSNKPKKALKYLSKYYEIKDSIFNKEKSKEFGRLEAKHEYEQEKRELLLVQEKRELELQQKREKTFLITSSVALILCILLAGVYYFSRLKTKNNKALTLKNELIEKQNIQIVNSAEKELKLLNEQIQARDRELAIYAMQFNERNNTLRKLESKLNDVKLVSENNSELDDVKKLINSNLNDKNTWDNFINKFEGVYPNFFEKLKISYDGLTLNQLKICAYIKVGMNNKDIAEATHTEANTVKKNINRLKKKMNLTGDESIRDFLISYS